jgi:hypothetical protein
MNSDNNNKLSLVPREQFIENIKRWVVLDTQIKTINEKTKIIRETKQNITNEICEYIEKNNLHNRKIEISDGNIKFYEKKEYSPLTYNYIEESLHKIIPNKEHVEYIIQYLKDNREIKTSPDIRRTFTK